MRRKKIRDVLMNSKEVNNVCNYSVRKCCLIKTVILLHIHLLLIGLISSQNNWIPKQGSPSSSSPWGISISIFCLSLICADTSHSNYDRILQDEQEVMIKCPCSLHSLWFTVEDREVKIVNFQNILNPVIPGLRTQYFL